MGRRARAGGSPRCSVPGGGRSLRPSGSPLRLYRHAPGRAGLAACCARRTNGATARRDRAATRQHRGPTRRPSRSYRVLAPAARPAPRQGAQLRRPRADRLSRRAGCDRRTAHRPPLSQPPAGGAPAGDRSVDAHRGSYVNLRHGGRSGCISKRHPKGRMATLEAPIGIPTSPAGASTKKTAKVHMTGATTPQISRTAPASSTSLSFQAGAAAGGWGGPTCAEPAGATRGTGRGRTTRRAVARFASSTTKSFVRRMTRLWLAGRGIATTGPDCSGDTPRLLGCRFPPVGTIRRGFASPR